LTLQSYSSFGFTFGRTAMFAKSKSVREDWRLQPLQRSAVAQPAATLHPPETISSIGSETMVVGKILCNEALNIYGLVEGEVIASNAFIADGARVQGDIIAEELIVGGRVNGNIHALRAKLQATAVVEGEISHWSLSIDEHAWFEGCSRPQDNPPEQPSSIKLENSTPQPWQQALVAFNDQEELQPDFTEPTQLRQSGMRAFLAACIAIMIIGVMSHLALSTLQEPTGLAHTTDNVRIDPGWMDRSTQLGATELLLGPQSTAVRPAIPETSQTATVATAPETIAPKTDGASLQEQMPQSLAMPQTASVSTAPQTAAPKTDAASLQEQAPQMMQGLAAPQTVEQSAAGQAQMASEEAKLQTADVEILAKIPVPRPRPTAAPTRKSMPVLPRSVRALITQPPPRIPPH
jgi:cytoskeletal protein CcmA (bactofilin family)